MSNFASVRNFCGAALAALALAIPAASKAQSGYSIIDLGTLGGSESYGNGINASGQVAGYSYTSGNSDYHAVRWTGTNITDLGTLGGTTSFGLAINDSGQVAGFAYTSGDAAHHAVRWTGTTVVDLGTLGGTYSEGSGINASGQVAGYSYTSGDAAEHAVRWTGNTATDLGTLGGTYSGGSAINASGQVAGYSYLSDNTTVHAVRWTGTTPQDLGTLGGDSSFGLAINASGQVAGYSYTLGHATEHAVRWTGTSMTDLGTLGGTYSKGFGLNRSGTVIGYSELANGDSHAFYAPGNTMLDLNSLLPANSGWILEEADAINDNGWITGGGDISGQRHAFLLIPNSVTVSGRIALEGVSDLTKTSSAAPFGAFHISFRIPGTTTEFYSADVSLTTTTGSAFGTFTAPNVPQGISDIAIKGAKNLRVLLPSVSVGANTTLPGVTLPGGDANNDNSVDSSDFGALIGAFNSVSSIPGSGYDPTVDLNFDGFVDSSDFGLLISEFNNMGAP